MKLLEYCAFVKSCRNDVTGIAEIIRIVSNVLPSEERFVNQIEANPQIEQEFPPLWADYLYFKNRVTLLREYLAWAEGKQREQTFDL